MTWPRPLPHPLSRVFSPRCVLRWTRGSRPSWRRTRRRPIRGIRSRPPRARLVDAGCAIEMVHAASLVLDDLPSMDDASLRRGRPALHVAHGEGNAILAAVTLLTRAFGSIAEAGLRARRGGLAASAALDLISRLADASGLA